jgi:cellulose biosynthesis protein BcsQ
MKQTALEWFYDKVIQKQYKDIDDSLEDLLNQAKEMEKQQIIEAYDIGFIYPIKFDFENNRSQDAEQYYNETFKNK